MYVWLQTARPVLYDAQLVNQMIVDMDRVDLNGIGSQALYAHMDPADTDVDINTECE